MRQAINQFLKARKGFELMERDDPMDVDLVHEESQKSKGKGNDKGKGESKGKSKGKGKQHEKGKSSGIKKSSKVQAEMVARQDTNGANVRAKSGRAAKQANSVGETEKTGDVNWIMMIEKSSVGQTSTSGLETWRCFGTSVSCQSVHESQVFIHAESDCVILNSSVASNVAGSRLTQADIRPESVNSVNPTILSNTAKLVVDSGCFDHCCPLQFATQFWAERGTFPQRISCKHGLAQSPRHQSCRGVDERRERYKDSAQDQIQRA